LPLVVERFNKYFNQNIEVSENDYIDIYKANNLNEIVHFLCKAMPFCRYCKLDDWQIGVEWGVSKKEISEWFDM
jgi:hypothetical protein